MTSIHPGNEDTAHGKTVFIPRHRTDDLGLGVTTRQWIQTTTEVDRNASPFCFRDVCCWQSVFASVLRDADLIEKHDRIRTMALAANGNQLALGFAHGEIELFDLRPNRDSIRLRERSENLAVSVLGLAIQGVPDFGWERPTVTFSPVGDMLACPSSDYSQLVILSLPDGKELKRTHRRKGCVVNCAAFCPKGVSLASVWSDGIVRVSFDDVTDPCAIRCWLRWCRHVRCVLRGRQVFGGR